MRKNGCAGDFVPRVYSTFYRPIYRESTIQVVQVQVYTHTGVRLPTRYKNVFSKGGS